MGASKGIWEDYNFETSFILRHYFQRKSVMRAPMDDQDERQFHHPDAVTDQAIEWVLKLQAREADRSVLDAWLAEGPDRNEALSRVLALYDCPALTVATAQTAAAPEAPVHRPDASIRMARQPRLLPLAFAASVAAALVAPLIGSDWLLLLGADHTTAAGEVTTVSLPDGSRMQMNSQTAVELDFDEGRRAVRLLKGEAFFDVAHDTTRPFTVTGGYGTVKVTGTAFVVARESDSDIVHLESGRITLTQDDEKAQPVQMMPGQTAAVDNRQIVLQQGYDGESRLAWREGWIQVSAMPLRTALAEIGRHTDLRIVTLPSAVLDTPVSGSFRISAADAAIDSVATAAGAKVERLPGGILIIH